MNPLGSNNEIVQNKLIILYIIDRLKMPVNNNKITQLVLETRLMNYFMFQQCFSELHDGKLIKLNSGTEPASGKTPVERNDTEGYLLTESGKNTLRYFLNLIPHGLKVRLDNLTAESGRNMLLDSLVTADLTPESEDKFTVLCKMEEKGFPLIELKAAAGTRKDARAICDNWRKHSADIYAEIMEALVKKRD